VTKPSKFTEKPGERERLATSRPRVVGKVDLDLWQRAKQHIVTITETRNPSWKHEALKNAGPFVAGVLLTLCTTLIQTGYLSNAVGITGAFVGIALGVAMYFWGHRVESDPFEVVRANARTSLEFMDAIDHRWPPLSEDDEVEEVCA